MKPVLPGEWDCWCTENRRIHMAKATRRSFLKQFVAGVGAWVLAPSLKGIAMASSPRIEISLAEWSLHRALYGGKLDNLDFPAKAKSDFGIAAVEYVNGFFGGAQMPFTEAGKNTAYL